MRGFLQFLGVLVLIAAFVVVGWLAYPTVSIWFRDVNREVTQHSQGYIESKTQLLMGLISDYEDPKATAGQKTAIVNEFCYQVTLLEPSERPAPIVRFQTAHC